MATTIWVSAEGSLDGDGSQSNPYATIDEAIKAAGPGTTIMVLPGTYVENVKIRDSGTADAPIVLKAAGPTEDTIIKPASDKYDTVDIGGADHIVLDGFTIYAPQSEMNGVTAYARTSDGGFDPASHITISNNVIIGGNGDGIKGSKAEYLTITGNTITGHTGEESAIDFVGVRHAQISNNRILDSAHHGVIIKGGSEHIVFENNLIDGTASSGIEIGGYTVLSRYWPGFLDSGLEFEARDIIVRGNEITNTGSTGLRVVGGQQVEITNNEIHNVGNYVVSIDDSSMYHDTWFSGDVTFTGNSFDRADWLKNRSEGEGITEYNNFTDGRDIVDADRIGTSTTDDTPPADNQAPATEEPALEPSTTQEPNPDSLGMEGTTEPDAVLPTLTGIERHGGGSRDDLKGTDGNDYLFGGDGNDGLQGGKGDDYLSGEAGEDRLEGEDGHDTLLGGDGSDEIKGGKGDDYLSGGAGEDKLDGEEGHDTLLGGDGDDQLEGKSGNDQLWGGGGNDEIKGGKGDDVIVGGLGADELEGKDGADQFVFDNLDACDVIVDFEPWRDHLVFDLQGVDSFADIDMRTSSDGDTVVYVETPGGPVDLVTIQDTWPNDLSMDHFWFL